MSSACKYWRQKLRVYRMENDQHVGPFNADVPGIPHELAEIMALCGNPHMLIEDIVDDAISHKEVTKKQMMQVVKLSGPEKDGIPDLQKSEVCAVTSLDQLREWFPVGMDRAMHDHGQSIHCYEVPDDAVRVGGHQCAVKKSALKGHEVVTDPQSA